MQKMGNRFMVALLATIFMWLASGSSLAQTPEDFLPPEQAFELSVAVHNDNEVWVHYRIAPDYYMYRDRFEFKFNEQAVQNDTVVFPPGLVKYDPTFELDMEVYYEQLTVRVPVPGDLRMPASFTLASQGCADAGLCYPPAITTFTLEAVNGGYQLQGNGVVDEVPAPLQTVVNAGTKNAVLMGAAGVAGATTDDSLGNLSDVGLAQYLASADIWTMVAVAFALGVLLTFTPCVLPMVPILMAVIAGTQSGRHPPSKWRGLSLAATYMLGVSILYTLMGVAAGLAGAGLAAWLQNPWALSVFALLLALLALAMFNVFSVQTPTALRNALGVWLQRIPGGHYSSTFLMGLVSALIVGPCVAAPLAGVLLFISQTGDAWLGAVALFALAWGQGVLLLVLGAGSGALLPKAGPWMESVKVVFGVLLLATAWWMLNAVLPAWLMPIGWAVLIMWSAVLLGAFRSVARGLVARLGKALGLLLAVWAMLILLGLASGSFSVFQPLGHLSQRMAPPGVGQPMAQAVPNVKSQFVKVSSVQELDALLANTDRPVLLDFYADWCVSCIEMERFTFTDAQVAASMNQFTLVQADVTRNTDADGELLQRFKLFGPPGIIFFDHQGRELEAPRVIGFMRAEPFNKALQQVLAQSGQTGSNQLGPLGTTVPGQSAGPLKSPTPSEIIPGVL